MTVVDLRSWRCTRDAVEVVRDAAAYLNLAAQSAPIASLDTGAANGAGASPAQQRLPLFSAALRQFEKAVQATQAGAKAGGRPPAGGSASKQQRVDDDPGGPPGADGAGAVMHVGGPVWALDWSVPVPPPLRAGSSAGGTAGDVGADSGGAGSSQFLAVAAHPAGREGNVIGRPASGPACVQLWEVQTGSNGGRQPGSTLLGPPRMAMALCHDGGVAWDVKWCPQGPAAADAGTGDASGHLPSVGLLAVALGSGDVEVLSVPHPSAVSPPAAAQGPAAALLLPPLAVRLSCGATLAAGRIGGSLASTLEWLPRPPHDLLLVGHWDGTAALWRLAPPAAGSDASAPVVPELLLHVRTEEGPIRSVAWAPAGLDDGGDALAGRSVFATAGHDGNVSVWDARDAYHPVMQLGLGVQYLLSADWPAANLPAVVTTDNGFLHVVWLFPRDSRLQRRDSNSTILRSGIPGAVWSAHTSADMVLAYGCEDGTVFTVNHVVIGDKRGYRPPHTAVFGWRQEGEVLRFLDRRALTQSCAAAAAAEPGGSGKGKGKSAKGSKGLDSSGAAFPSPPALAVHRVRWSRNAGADSIDGGGGGSSADGRGGTVGAGAKTLGWLAHGGAAGLVCIQRPL